MNLRACVLAKVSRCGLKWLQSPMPQEPDNVPPWRVPRDHPDCDRYLSSPCC
jgi:hypothetical protein